MTSTQSLAACAAADVTWERVRALVALSQPESLTLEYKSTYTPGLVKTVAAMANSYGGLILVGVIDSKQATQDPTADRIVGVPGETVTKIANACDNCLEPSWQPEPIPVAVPSEQDKFVVVVRVDPSRAPRPILFEGKAPIRLHGNNATADRARLAQLFTEVTSPAGRAHPALPRPQLPQDSDGQPTADYILRSGMQIPVDGNASWRPLSERGVRALASALNNSPLHHRLLTWCDELHIHNLNQFDRRGYNRARHVRLVWQALTEGHMPIEVIAEAVLPPTPGVPNSHLRFTLDILPRIRPYVAARAAQNPPPGFQPAVASLNVAGLHRLVDAILATLTDSAVVEALAGLAGIDPLAIPQPSSLDVHSGATITESLDMHGLKPTEGAGTSHGANLLAQPALDLHDATERHRQVDDWLIELALDAGLTGMEALLDLYHQAERKHVVGR